MAQRQIDQLRAPDLEERVRTYEQRAKRHGVEGEIDLALRTRVEYLDPLAHDAGSSLDFLQLKLGRDDVGIHQKSDHRGAAPARARAGVVSAPGRL